MKNYITNYDPFFNSFFFDKSSSFTQMMKTDIKENKDNYLMKVNVPDVKKENIKIELKNGYLTITATTCNEEDNGEYLYHEREYGEFSRSYYVGEGVNLKDVHAKLNDGVLSLTINKVEKKEQNNIVTIE